MKYNALFKLLKKHGWYEVRQKGSHVILQHPNKKGRITVPYHSSKEVKRLTQEHFKTNRNKNR